MRLTAAVTVALLAFADTAQAFWVVALTEPPPRVGVPTTGEAVTVPYRASARLAPPTASGPVFWFYRDGRFSGICGGPDCGISVYESASTRGHHEALVLAWQTYCPYTCINAPFSADSRPYVVQYLPTAEILSAPGSLDRGEPGVFSGFGTVDLEYSLSKLPIFTWDFGDGDVRVGSPTTVKAYTAEGTYTVKFTVSDGYFSQTISRSLSVRYCPGIDICPNPD